MTARTTSHADRVAMIDRHLAGEALEQIAASMQLSYYTVRTCWRRYQRHGWPALDPKPAGPSPTGALGRQHPRIKYVLLRLKRQHRGWGVDKLRLELSRRPSLAGLILPHRSSRRRLRTIRPLLAPLPPLAPHHTWQMDFKGDEPVASVGRVAPFMVCDTASGAPLGGIIHTIRTRGERHGIDARTVQADLRQVFARWGLPDSIRMDRDSVFVGSSRLEWPGTLLLWLIGLGVQPIINRAYRPTDNAIVERNHQTWQAHVLSGPTYPSLDAIQVATEQAFADRREQLPSRHPGCDRRPFLVAFPTLLEPRRPYCPEEEGQQFDLARVDAYLADWVWRRTIDSTGQISLANHNYRVGMPYRGQSIKVGFDRSDRTFVGRLATGQEVGRWVVPEVDPVYIRGVDH